MFCKSCNTNFGHNDYPANLVVQILRHIDKTMFRRPSNSNTPQASPWGSPAGLKWFQLFVHHFLLALSFFNTESN